MESNTTNFTYTSVNLIVLLIYIVLRLPENAAKEKSIRCLLKFIEDIKYTRSYHLQIYKSQFYNSYIAVLEAIDSAMKIYGNLSEDIKREINVEAVIQSKDSPEYYNTDAQIKSVTDEIGSNTTLARQSIKILAKYYESYTEESQGLIDKLTYSNVSKC